MRMIVMKYQKAAICAGIVKAAAHPTRLRIIDELRQGDRCVRDLTAHRTINQCSMSRDIWKRLIRPVLSLEDVT